MNSHQRRILRRSLGDMPRLPNNALFISSEAKRAQGYYVAEIEHTTPALQNVKINESASHESVQFRLDALYERIKALGGNSSLDALMHGHTVMVNTNRIGFVSWYVDGIRTPKIAVAARVLA